MSDSYVITSQPLSLFHNFNREGLFVHSHGWFLKPAGPIGEFITPIITFSVVPANNEISYLFYDSKKNVSRTNSNEMDEIG